MEVDGEVVWEEKEKGRKITGTGGKGGRGKRKKIHGDRKLRGGRKVGIGPGIKGEAQWEGVTGEEGERGRKEGKPYEKKRYKRDGREEKKRRRK
jgi:hypothetical protein